MGCWHGYVSAVRCRFACGPADAIATHCLYYYYSYNRFMALWILSGITLMSRFEKCKTKTNLVFLEKETVSSYMCESGLA